MLCMRPDDTQADPRYDRRVSLELELEPSPVPYVVLPYLTEPGAEAPFTLSLLCDAKDDATGAPAFSFEPVRPATDWHTSRVTAPWSAAPTPPTTTQFFDNLQLRLALKQRGHVFVFVETLGVARDTRTTEGLQEAPAYPAIGFVLADATAGGGVPVPAGPLRELPATALNMPAEARDGVWYEATLEPSEAHVIIPYLGEEHAGAPPSAELQLCVTVYSDVPHTLGGAPAGGGGVAPAQPAEDDGWKCEMCANAFPRRTCPFHVVYCKMARLEEIMDQRLALMDHVIARSG